LSDLEEKNNKKTQGKSGKTTSIRKEDS